MEAKLLAPPHLSARLPHLLAHPPHLPTHPPHLSACLPNLPVHPPHLSAQRRGEKHTRILKSTPSEAGANEEITIL
jgi:hypothetical protein